MTFYKAVCDFAEERIEPNYLDWERNHQLIPDEIIEEMGQMGLFGVTVSEDYGGQGGNQLDLILTGLALGYHSQSLAITPGAATSLGAKPLQLFGTEKQKQDHLPDLAVVNACSYLDYLNPDEVPTQLIHRLLPRKRERTG